MSDVDSNLMLSNIKIDVVVITYNHEKYIIDCLNSILNQKMITFINLIILDDGSTDNTVSKILKFIEENRLITRIEFQFIPNKRNKLGSEDYNPIKTASDYFNFKYFAILEGDDYWIDDEKLYNQFLIMERNLDVVGCHSMAIRLRESNKNLFEQKFDLLPARNVRKDLYTFEDFISENGVMSGTVLLRRKIFNDIKSQLGKTQPGDWWLFLLMSQYGSFFLYNKITTVYRVHENNFWITQTPSTRLRISIDMLRQFGSLTQKCHNELKVSIDRKIKFLESISNSNQNFKESKKSYIFKLIYASKYCYLPFVYILNVLNLRFCPMCQNIFKSFRPLDKKFTESLLNYGWDLSFDDSEMCNVSEYHCPKCDSSDRDRFYSHWLIINKKHLNLRMFLDISPNSKLTDFILKFVKPKAYLTLDLFSADVDINADIQKMDIFPDEIFDFVLCSHVLEHVTDDNLALREIYRILNADSIALLIAPISLSLKHTREDPNITEPEQRWKHFGQDDHLRHYSKPDFIKRIRNANFNLSFYDKSESASFIFKVLGLSKTSTLYLGKKQI